MDPVAHVADRACDGRSSRRLVVQVSIVIGGVLLAAAGLILHHGLLLALCLSVTLSTMAIVQVVGYMKLRHRTANRSYEELLDGINAYVFETDFQTGEILYMNQRTRQIIGPGARSAQPLLDLVHPDDRHLATDTELRARQSGQPATIEVRVQSRSDICYVEMRTTISTRGTRRRVRTILIDVSDRKRAELELAHRAVHDPLTDLPNRSLLDERLDAALCPTTDVSTPNALLLLDLNNLRRINDALGHASGDHLLVELAGRLQRIADPDDTVARLGGDEFAVLMPRADHVHALEFAHRCAVVLSAPWKDRGVTINPRVSIGIAVAQGPAEGETLLREADTAMYECKRTGADHVIYDDNLEGLHIERLNLLRAPIARPLRNRIGDRLGNDLCGSELVEEPQ